MMPKTRFNEFPALSVDPRILHFLVIFLTNDIKTYHLASIVSFILTFYVAYSRFQMSFGFYRGGAKMTSPEI